jgi:predicted RNA-binding Zn ribbon-like protein
MQASPLLIRDFVNTLEIDTGVDEIGRPSALRDWLAARGLAARRTRVSAEDLADAVAVREALRTLLLANNGVEANTVAAARTLDRAARGTGLAVRFAPDGRARLEPAAAGAAAGIGRILAAAAEAMSSPDWPRLKACRADDCRWAFVDEARNRSRAWCDMKTCGNRQKAQRFRERHGSRS